ncbi:MAG: DUF1961 family protein [Candidatus Latescibacteria bacterium]|nr:DUF1961 family protein [Candidatus Latescibacterota bacterium]
MDQYDLGKILYENPLASESDVRDFRLEGDAAISFPQGRMRLENKRSPEEGQAANYVLWCPKLFPSDIAVSWDFYPIREPGLAMFWFAANGKDGKDLFDPSFAPRTGQYQQYHHGDINALHISYFRRNTNKERTFQTCNMRKSYGFHLVCQGADPIPTATYAEPPYRIQVIKDGAEVTFSINNLQIFRWEDDGESYGPVLGGGRIGFRQMAPLIAEYANLTVHRTKGGIE